MFVGSVIIAAVCSCILYVGYIAHTYKAAITPAPRQVVTERLTRPQVCGSLLEAKDPATWNPVTDEYPHSIEWRTCMGVE